MNVADAPLVSICIPCYNGAEFLSRTLQSALRQTFTDFEVIVADNKSTDDTRSVVRSFSDPRIKLVENESNLGMTRNCMRALGCASGKYLKLLCADDVLHPECLSRQVAILNDPSCSSVVLAVCARNIIDTQDHVILRRAHRISAGVVPGKRLIRSCVRWGTNLIGEPVVGLFRKEYLPAFELSTLSNPYLIDLHLWAEVLKHGDAFVDSQVLASFRISGQSASTRLGFQQAAYFRRFMRAIRQDPHYKLTFPDILAGSLLSFQWCLVRNLVIKQRTSGKPQTLRPTMTLLTTGENASSSTIHAQPGG